MERYFDLNGRENSITAKIKVADKEFKINRVVIAVRVLYSNHLIKMGELFKETGQLDEKNINELDSLNEKINEFNEDKIQTYEKILTLLLEKNGYRYEKQWWNENTDELDIRSFIDSCLSKDVVNNNKKKVLD